MTRPPTVGPAASATCKPTTPNPNAGCSKCSPPKGCRPTSRSPSSPTAATTSPDLPRLPQSAGRASAGLVPPHDADHRADPPGQGSALRTPDGPDVAAQLQRVSGLSGTATSSVPGRPSTTSPPTLPTPMQASSRASWPRRSASSEATSPRTPPPYPTTGSATAPTRSISSSFVESAVNQVISKRMVKKQ